tara:strand:- start:299 stop:919 length:621 start_codon:yes stop_codon:yes gene_type:complete
MDFLIKAFMVLPFLTSCTSYQIDSYYPSLRDILVPDKIIINPTISNSPYAMEVIQIDSSDEFLSVLASVTNGVMRWAGSNGVILHTMNGKIIKTKGLDVDFKIINYKGFTKVKKQTTYIEFSDPASGLLEINFEYNVIKTGLANKRINGDIESYRLIEESFYVPLIDWKGVNYFWVNDDNYVIRTKQITSPFGSKIRTTSLKKYSG